MTEPVDPGSEWPPQQPYGGYPPQQSYQQSPYSPQQPYGYPQGPYPQQPYAYPPPPPAPPRHNVRRIAIASVVAAVVVAGAVTGGVLASNSSDNNSASTKKLVAPQTVGEYHIATGAAADQLQSEMRDRASGIGGGAPTLMEHATITVYSDQGDAPTLVFIGMPRSEVAKIGGWGDDAQVVQQMLSAAVTDSQPFDSGSRGGALRCGAITYGSASETMCAWSDSHTAGLITSANPAKPPQQLADTANQFRDALR